jgi:hypothetical protein
VDRVLTNAPATISQQWFSGGTAVDPGVVTIQIDRADGTSLVSAGTATSGTGVNPRTFNLTSTHTNQLDRLKSTWTSGTLGKLVNYHEIVGGFLFTISQGIAETGQTAAIVAEARVRAELQLEDACGIAFVPRYARETVSALSGRRLLLSNLRVRTVRTVTVDGVAMTAGELAEVLPNGNILWNDDRIWERGIRNVVVDYEHGMDFPPGGADIAALKLAETYFAGSTSIDLSNPRLIEASAGEETFRFSPGTASSTGRFGISEVDSFV